MGNQLPPIDSGTPFGWLHIEHHRLRTAIDKQLQGFNAAEYIDLEKALLAADEDWSADEVKALHLERDTLIKGISTARQHAAWACFHLGQMDEHSSEECWAALMRAQRSLAGESQSEIQRQHSKGNPNWYTQPLIEICKSIRIVMPRGTVEEVFNALCKTSKFATPITKIKNCAPGFGNSLLIEAAKTRHSDKSMSLGQFRKFMTKHKETIGRKKTTLSG